MKIKTILEFYNMSVKKITVLIFGISIASYLSAAFAQICRTKALTSTAFAFGLFSAFIAAFLLVPLRYLHIFVEIPAMIISWIAKDDDLENRLVKYWKYMAICVDIIAISLLILMPIYIF